MIKYPPCIINIVDRKLYFYAGWWNAQEGLGTAYNRGKRYVALGNQ